MYSLIKKIGVGTLIAVAMSACGGGGGGGTSAVTDDSSQGVGIDRLGVTTGTVTGFGSIFVNGVRFDTDSAEFDVDDDSVSSSQESLEVGDIVLVTFDPSISSTTALTVFSDDAVEGPIESIDAATGELIVVGQQVLVDADTSFDDSIPTASLDGLEIGDNVEVNGFFDSDGAIRATRIELGDGEIEVQGVVSNLDTVAETFSVNDLEVDYGSVPAEIDDDFAGGSFVNGDLVEVKGNSFSVSGALLATKVEPGSAGFEAGRDLGLDEFDEVEVEVEGYITRFTSASDFAVAGFPVITNSGTQFEGGSAADLALDVKVEVEGELNSDGVLVAEEVEFRQASDLRVTALVDSVDPATDTLVMLGISVRVDDLTRLEDKSETDLESFSIFDISVGDYVEVRGSADSTGGAQILASLLEREETPDVPGEETSLRGFVESISEPDITVLGVTIQTDAGTQFEDVAETPVSAAEFFTLLSEGGLIEAEGTESGQMMIFAEEVELED